MVGPEGKVLASESFACAGFTYSVDPSQRSVDTPIINSIDNPYMGKYTFQVRGGNKLYPFPQFMSDIYEFKLKLKFVSDNKPPILVTPPRDITVYPGRVQQRFIGKIFDPDGDSVFLERWKIQGDNAVEWVSFVNSTNIDRMYFDFAPPADMDMEDFNFQIELTLADTNMYAAETEASFNV